MRMRISDSELGAMSPAAQERKLAEMVARTRDLPNGELVEVREQLAGLESKFGLDSDSMRRQVLSGDRAEDLETCQWLMLLNRRSRLERRLESSSPRA